MPMCQSGTPLNAFHRRRQKVLVKGEVENPRSVEIVKSEVLINNSNFEEVTPYAARQVQRWYNPSVAVGTSHYPLSPSR